VPLFGPTVMSTSEPAGAQTAGQPPAPPTAMANAFGSVGGGEFGAGLDDSSSDDADDKKHKVADFTHGKVSHPVVLRIRTDGAITAMHGMRTPTGFTVSLPGRHAPEATSALAARDPRVASLHVNSGSKGTEVTVQFKDGVPPYAVHARGHDVVIALGRPAVGDERDDAKTGAVAKKGSEPTRHRGKSD